MTALLPGLGIPHAHEAALRAFDKFCAALRPSAVVQTGRLFATTHPARADLDRAARWLSGLAGHTSVTLVATPAELDAVSEAIRLARANNATLAHDEYPLPDSNWIVHHGPETGSASDSCTGSRSTRFPGSVAIGLAHRKQTNVVCGHTGLRGIITEIQETNSTPVERWGMEIGHLRADPTRTETLGFGVLLVDTTTNQARPTLIRVEPGGAIRYGGARFTPSP